MWIRRVLARSFGPHLDAELKLASGMNIVFGPNEAGKSSWHAAIFAGLCGMSRGRGARTKEDREFVEQHKPWSGDDWSVTTVVELDEGRTIEIFQDLDDLSNCRAIDQVTGKDITQTILTDQTPDGARFLGLTRKTFPPTLLVRQAEMLKVLEEPGELQEQLQRAAATAGADETAEAAIERIEQFHKEFVGTTRARTKPFEST
ncbi:MAG: AAA family ATPase, partial [Rhodothermia bacterium]